MPLTKTEQIVNASLKARKKKERAFQLFGIAAIALALFFLVMLMGSILSKGIPGFFQYYVTLEVELDRDRLDPLGNLSEQSLFDGQAKKIIEEVVLEKTGAKSRNERKAARKLTDLRGGYYPADFPDGEA